jgi:hypothetical protein
MVRMMNFKDTYKSLVRFYCARQSRKQSSHSISLQEQYTFLI